MLTHARPKAAPNFTIIDAVANHWQYVIITTKQRLLHCQNIPSLISLELETDFALFELKEHLSSL